MAIQLTEDGPVPSSREEAATLQTLDRAFRLRRAVQEKGWPGYVPEVARVLEGAGLEVAVPEGVLAQVRRQLAPMKGWDGKRYRWLDSIETYGDEWEQNRLRLLRAGWELFPFALDDAAEIAIRDQAILAYEPGLGKTRASLAIAELWRATRILVVAPRRLHVQWYREIAKTPLRTPVTIVSYDDLWREEATYPDHDVAILDEAHAIKNPDTLRFKAAAALAAEKRLALTGTPTGGYLRDIEGILKFLSAKKPYVNPLRPDYREIYGFVAGERERPGLKLGEQLRSAMAHVLKVRSRHEPEVELANQTPILVADPLQMEPDLEVFYLENARAVREWWLREDAQKEARARLGLHRILRAAVLPQSLPGWGDRETNLQRRVLKLMEWAGDGTLLVASHIDVAEWYAERLGVPAVTSKMPISRRQKVIDEFKSAGGRLVATIGVIGEGWNLQEAHTMVFAELDWRAHMIVQAIYRIIRPGQRYVPTIVFPYYKDTVMEYMAKMISAKARAMRAFTDGHDATPDFPSFKTLLARLVLKVKEREER